MFSEIKNNCFLSIQPLLVKAIQVEEKVEEEKVGEEKVKEEKKLNYTSNKLISSYEEDYTRNNTEIMKLWQRN